MEAKLAVEPLYISSIVLPSSSLSITVSVFLYDLYDSKLFHLLLVIIHHPKMARVITARQIANLAARNTQNSTASATAAAAPLAPPA
jgi:hypothetical protein